MSANWSLYKHKDIDSEGLKREFSLYGEVVFARVVRDLEGKSRGYGFVEFSNNSEFLTAFRTASGKFFKGKQIVVDAEYARLSKSFRPMRLGGGLGATRKSKGRRYQRYFLF